MTRLPALASAAGIQLSTSLLAVERSARLALAIELTEQQQWVHADVITGSYRGQEGLPIEDLSRLAAIPGILLDIHFMVDRISDVLPLIPEHVRRVTTQLSAVDSNFSAAITQLRRKADEVWIALAPADECEPTDSWLQEVDGILIMLTPPGQPGHTADLDRLHFARSLNPVITVGIDGGVTADNLPQASASGVSYAVAGRALFDISV